MILRRADGTPILEAEVGTRLVSTRLGLVVSEPSGRVRILHTDGAIETITEPPRHDA